MKWLILLNLFFGLQVMAEESSARPSIMSNENCIIHIKVLMKNGKTKKESKKYKFEKEEKCKNLSEIYKENFSPEYVKKVDVDYKWLK